MSEKETWYSIEVSYVGENDWYAVGNATYDSAETAWREVRRLRKGSMWDDATRWEFRVVRKDLTTTVEPEDSPMRVCAKCRNYIANMHSVVTADDGALFHGRCWNR